MFNEGPKEDQTKEIDEGEKIGRQPENKNTYAYLIKK